MTPYIYCFAFSCLFTYFADRTKYKTEQFIFSLIAILIPSVLAGLRAWTIGADVLGYGIGVYRGAMQAESIWNVLLREGTLAKEAGWLALTYFSTKLFGSLNWNLFFYSLLTHTCFYIGAWKHRKFVSLPMTMLVFYCMEYSRHLCIIRQSIAASIIFMGLDHLEKRHYGRFFIYIIAATLFHSSALFCVTYLIGFHFLLTCKTPSGRNSKVAKYVLYSIIMLLFMSREIFYIIIVSIPLFAEKYGGLSMLVMHTYSLGLMLLGELVIFLLYGNGGRRVFARNAGGIDMFYFYRYGIIFGMVLYMWVHMFHRVYLYFDYVNLIVYAALPKFIKEKHLRVVISIIVIAAYLYFFYYICRKNYYSTYPYVSIFD